MEFYSLRRKWDADMTRSHLTDALSRPFRLSVIRPVFLLATAIIEYLLIPDEQFRQNGDTKRPDGSHMNITEARDIYCMIYHKNPEKDGLK